MLTKQITVFDRDSIVAYLTTSYGMLFNQYDSLSKIVDESKYLYVRLTNETSFTIYLLQGTATMTVHVRKLYTDIQPHWKLVYPINTDLTKVLDDIKDLVKELSW